MTVETIGWPVFERHRLDDSYSLWVGRLPAGVIWSNKQFSQMWDRHHPPHFHQVRMFGKLIDVPRWSETYGRDYRFSGTVQAAKPEPRWLEPLLRRAQDSIEARCNGLLFNWYDAVLGQYIGRHRDDEGALTAGAPIITISFGAPRTFRLRRWRGSGSTTSPSTTAAC